jgi:Holliday junction resolvase-like predicted endonuclease
VVQRGDVLRFVEVKARDPGDESALESIDGLKQARLAGTAEAWLVGKGLPAEVAFLVAIVSFEPAGWTIEWFDDAF